ncbi:hypothetical protein [Pseudoalteromonas peptidolytica]|uniref:Solute-binding protein family 3/N-terminal domain-containing protein n=1 Tax=Pseudoalteromonas peptidolytica F12-50-A1 TaxID=1315280 RepID=A0A8I0MW71_9GAMM|nr:hypothetical protein [Pseudoalteromonas peptidolytica]MBE0347000.1 hypothetical protein [Pseudoalteromonas peptidolytica F12-50-A1]NLR14053.1 hypothetical protein [Pseudoalteromonas peptidolytica]GEK11006.1 hypothetical protein PPE03_32550 [Pseudoalteromonas peptidolytica]
MKMKWVCWLLFISPISWGSNQLVVDIISSENFSQRYEDFLAGRHVLDVDTFHPTTKGSHIEIIEMVLLQQALFLGGETRQVVFNPKPSVNILEFSDLIAGESLILARSVWHESIVDYRGALFISEPIVEVGEYEAGLYVTKRNVALQQTPLSQLRQLDVVSNPRWAVDWRALMNTDLHMVSFIGPWETMLEMVESNVVDTMLINFSVSDSLVLTFEGKEYVPIEDIKVVLPDSRHFVVSKNHPEGEQIFAALNRGLHVLKQRGIIKRALTESGFINKRVANWQVANAKMVVEVD